jgi:hypothetical protein
MQFKTVIGFTPQQLDEAIENAIIEQVEQEMLRLADEGEGARSQQEYREMADEWGRDSLTIQFDTATITMDIGRIGQVAFGVQYSAMLVWRS